MKKRIISLLLALVMSTSLLPVQAWGETRYEIINPNGVTGTDIVCEAKKWANVEATYWSASSPWPYCLNWRTGFTYQGQTSFDCSGFVSRVLNDLGFRGKDYAPNYGECILKSTYGSNFISTEIAHILKYGLNIDNAVYAAKNGDYSLLIAGDIIGWENDSSLGNHIIIYAGMNENGVPTMVEFCGSGYLYRQIPDLYIKAFQHGARFADNNAGDTPSPSGDYLSKCTPYPSYVKIKITEATTIKSLPCSKKTDPNSTDIRNGVIGEALTATAIYKNSAGNYWYQVSVDGTTGYVYSGNTTVSEHLGGDVTISGVSAPTQIKEGSTFSIKGDIRSSYNVIKKVNGYITGGKEYSGSATVNGKSYSLYGSTVDYALYFNYLPVGSYNYSIKAECEHNYSTDGSTLKTYSFTKKLVDQDFAVSGSSHTHQFVLKTDDEYHWWKCSCGATTDTGLHSYGNWVTKIEATHTEDGLRSRTCSVCGYTMTSSISAMGHSYAMKSDHEYHWYECSCGETYGNASHSYGDWITIEERTCTCGGRWYRVCAVCNKGEVMVSSAPGHAYDDGVVDENDCVTYTCTVCGDILVGSAFDYEFLDDGTISIIGYRGFHTKIVIPSEIDGYPVTAIGDYAFENCDSLTNITIPDSVTTIGSNAFEACSSLTSITIPGSITTIDSNMFWGCDSLTSITIPDSVTSIGDCAFSYCNNLTDVYYSGSAEQWHAISVGNDNDCLTSAAVHYGFTKGDLNDSGGADILDIACLYDYLTRDTLPDAYCDKKRSFTFIADINGDGDVDVYDIQQLYEAVSGSGAV